MANGNSKMFHSDALIRCIENAGLEVEEIHDNIGLGHSILPVSYTHLDVYKRQRLGYKR